MYGALFIVDKIVYGIDKYDVSPTKIIYKFNLETKKEENISIDFENKGNYDSSLHYNWKVNQLWTINNS